MPLLTQTEDALLDEGLRQLRATTPVRFEGRGSTARALLEIAAREHAAIHQRLEVMQRDSFLSTAQGTSLDRLGELLGIERTQALRAFDTSRNVRFYIDPSLGETATAVIASRVNSTTVEAHPDTLTPTGFTIKAGAQLTASTGVTYSTTDDAIFAGADIEQFVGVIANGAGSSFNVASGELTRHDLQHAQPEFVSFADFILVDNRMPISNGVFPESDEALRFRIKHALLTVQAANPTSAVQSVLSVPGVRTAVYVPYDGGLHSFSIVIQATDPIVSDGLVRACQQVLNRVVAAGNRGLVRRPIYHGLQVKLALAYRPRADRLRIRQLVRRAAVNYINAIEVGDPFILNELIQRVQETDDLLLDHQFEIFARGIYNPTLQRLERVQVQPPSNLSLTSHLDGWYTSDRLFIVCDQ